MISTYIQTSLQKKLVLHNKDKTKYFLKNFGDKQIYKYEQLHILQPRNISLLLNLQFNFDSWILYNLTDIAENTLCFLNGNFRNNGQQVLYFFMIKNLSSKFVLLFWIIIVKTISKILKEVLFIH